jgi:hypothetical protein
MKTKIYLVLITIWLLALSVMFCIYTCANSFGKSYTRDVYIERLDSKYFAVREELACEVDRYIQEVAPGAILSPLKLIELCAKYNVDLRFVLAQGHLESHFGTRGSASKTHSVFNVGAYDGHSAERQRKNGFAYEHPDQSIKPYLKLLNSRYLVNKTEFDLLQQFVDINGKRYASNLKYEGLLQEKFQYIDKYTNITEIYNQYKMYKLQLGY